MTSSWYCQNRRNNTSQIHLPTYLLCFVLLCLYHQLWGHDDVIKWKHFPRYWPFVRGIFRRPVDSPHKVQWRRVLMFSLMIFIFEAHRPRDACRVPCRRTFRCAILLAERASVTELPMKTKPNRNFFSGHFMFKDCMKKSPSLIIKCLENVMRNSE